MLKYVVRLIHISGFIAGYVKGFPRGFKRGFQAFWYGGTDKIPKEVLEQDLREEIQNTINSDDYQFTVAVGMLHDKFHIPYTSSNTFQYISNYYCGKINGPMAEYTALAELMKRKTPRREVYNLMVEKKDITEHKLNFYFPVGEKRLQLENFLDHKSNSF